MVWRPLKMLGFVCSMKKKAIGTLKGRMTANGCSQKSREQYISSLIHALITNGMMICMIFMLMFMVNWETYIINVKDALLYGRLQGDKSIHENT